MHTLMNHPVFSILTRFAQQARRPRARVATPLAVLPLVLLCLALASSQSLLAQFQPVVSYSETTINNTVGASPVVTDACGNVYMYQNNAIVQVNATTGAITVVEADTQGYNATTALYMDAAKANLYFPDPTAYYTTHFDQLTIVNCAPGYLNNNFASNLYNLPSPNYYWGTASDIAGDANGDVFFTTSQGSTNQIYLEAYSASANTYSPYLILNWSKTVTFIVADAAGNVYFTDGSANLYLLKAGSAVGSYTVPTAAFASGFKSISGLSIDPEGDLYVADGSASLVYEIPLEATGLNPADKYAVASIAVVDKVAVDLKHNLYLSNYYPGLVKVTSGSAVATNTTYGSSNSFAVDYVFNAATTPTSITVDSGNAASTAFAATSGGCAANTTYAVGSTCAVNLSYTPNAVGLQTGAVILGNASGVLNVTQLSGTGLGAAITIDPGSVTSLATSIVTPAGVAVDNVGNVFVTDQKTNKLYEFVGGTGTPTAVGTGTLTLNTPTGVAVDSQGDIFIADTGNNRIVEIPSINGVLTNASTAALTLNSAAKAPQGVAFDARGSLFITDTGNNRLIYIPTVNGTLNFAATQTYTGLNTPTAVTVDATGNVYVAEAGTNDVLEYTTPVGSAAALKIAASLNTPTGLATDASASLFVADGSGNIYRYPNVGGNLGTRTLVGSTVVAPVGVAVDKVGNLYVTDSLDSVVDEISRVQTALQFGTWNVNATSNPQTESILSSGNTSVVFQSPSYTKSGATTAGFAVTNDGCAGQTILAGGDCTITSTFTPPVLEANAQETLTFASNASNGTPKLVLTGTGAAITASTVALVLTSPTPPLKVGNAATFTATIGTGSNNASPGGLVDFYVNGNLVGTEKVNGGKAVLSLASLTAGQLTITAVYTGDQINYSGSEASITETVVALPDSLTLTATTTWNNPQSVNDSYANATGPKVPLIATLTLSSTLIPGGTVTFYSGSTALGTASVVPASGGLYTATLNTTALRAGTSNVVEGGGYLTNYNLSAIYSGDNNYNPATSNTVTIAVVGPPTTKPACSTAATPTCYSSPTGATFTISPNPLAITVTSTGVQGQGQGAGVLTITSYGGWSGYVDFTCSGLPAYTTCNPYPGTPQVTASTPGAPEPVTTVQFFINTNVTPIVPTASSMIWWISGLLGFLLLAMRRKVRRLGFNRLCTLAAIALLMVSSVAGMSGCSTGVTTFTTPAGTSNITVTVHAAQGVPGSTNQATYLNDYNVPSFQIALTVK